MDTAVGFAFVILWASASIAAKFGFKDAAPLTVLDLRFALAAVIILTYLHVVRRRALPARGDWRHLVVLGFTNSTGYLGLAWLALQHVSVGLFGLFIATNPFLVALLSRAWLGRVVTSREWTGMAISAAGLGLATSRSLHSSHTTTAGVLMTVGSMLIYSFGMVYLKRCGITLAGTVLNGWQIGLGALFLLPFALAMNGHHHLHVSWRLAGALAWSVFAVSLLANAIWFHLLRKDPVRNSTWLFLTPVFGYVEAAIVLGEKIKPTDLIGMALVLAGLTVAGTLDLGNLRRRRPAEARTG
jgi:drug/metabolite transporter (DMT)-like permease